MVGIHRFRVCRAVTAHEHALCQSLRHDLLQMYNIDPSLDNEEPRARGLQTLHYLGWLGDAEPTSKTSVAVTRFVVHENKEFELGRVFVRPDARNNGYASQMVRFMIADVVGVTDTIVGFSLPHLVDYYRRFGFVPDNTTGCIHGVGVHRMVLTPPVKHLNA